MASNPDDHVQIDLQMTLTIINPSLYCQFEDDQLVGMYENFVDDFLRAGADEWKTHSNATLERFEPTGNQQISFTFSGIHITESDNM